MSEGGGRQNERRKWIHLFAKLNVCVYIVNSIGYLQAISDDYYTNDMKELLDLFEN